MRRRGSGNRRPGSFRMIRNPIFAGMVLVIGSGLVMAQGPNAAAAGPAGNADAPSSSSSAETAPAATRPAPVAPKGEIPVPGDKGEVQDKRAFGVLPNYRTADGTAPFHPITTRQKFAIATKDTFDWPSYILAGAFAGISQLGDSNPDFGQGAQGYAKRYGASVADQDMGNYMTEAIMPTLLHQDPRYFRKGTGTVKGRIWYAATRVFVARGDSGRWQFNASEVLGNGTVAALGNLYYPDDVGLSPTMQRMFTQIGTDALSQVMKEFWPDIKRKLFHKRDGNMPLEPGD